MPDQRWYKRAEQIVLDAGSEIVSLKYEMITLMEEALKKEYRAGLEAAAKRVEAKREEVLAAGHDAAWTEPYVELAAELSALAEGEKE